MSIKSRKFAKGILTKPTTDPATREGEQRTDSAENKQKIYLDGTERSVVTEDQSQVIINKTIDADNNTISNLEVDDLKSGVLNTDLSGPATDTELPSALAVKTALEGQNEAVEIVYDPADSSNTQTNVKDAIDENSTRLDVTETATATNATNLQNHLDDTVDAHDASSISNIPSGNLTSTDQQSVNDELQSDIDTRALASDLTDHINDTADAHTASAITNIPSGNLTATDMQSAVDELQTDIDTRATSTDLTTHTSATSGVHGVTGDVVGTTDPQTLTNKVIQGASIESPSRLSPREDTQANLETYAVTAQNGELVFATDTKLSFRVVDGELVDLGSGSGASGINHITNPDFEIGTDDWTTTGLVLSQETINPLRGSASLKITKPASNLAGSIVQTDFSIEKADLATIQIISFDYDLTDANYNNGDLVLQIGKIDGGTLINIPLDNEALDGGQGTFYARFQTDAVIQDYNLRFLYTSTSTDVVDMIIDNVRVAPQVIQQGTIVTDWEDYTPTGDWNVSATYEGAFRRVGSNVEALVKFSAGADGNVGDFQLNASDLGIMSETEKDLSSLVVRTIGSGSILDNGVSRYAVQVRYITTSDKIQVVPLIVNSTYASTTTMNANAPFNFSSGDEIQISFTYSVQGWSSQARMSSDFGNREVSLKYNGNNGDSIVADLTQIPFTAKSEDTTGSWNGTSFIAPEKGRYVFSGATRATSPVIRFLKPFLNGTFIGEFYGSPSSIQTSPFYFEMILSAGDEVDFRSGNNFTLLDDLSHVLNIRKLTTPETNLEVETVAARYTSDSGQSIGLAVDTLVFEDKDYDTHNMYDSIAGQGVIPVSGYYNFSTFFELSGIVTAVRAFITINGVNMSGSIHRADNFTNTGTSLSDTLYLNTNDIFEIRGNVSSGTNLISSDPERVFFSIIRIK